ncbi:MAG: tRNA (adenosine(37)-N6)-dimethylallyltransferase MiaA, partial [Campylobacterota bacterium]|nr:tRNA (adenosine(37)-N6)-dimethylallyltransferase MiaA [Campylobacterota bacterium]
MYRNFDIILFMKQIAIIGPTASGKSSLAVDIAKETNSVILSLDSLSVYKQIDIASAKPTKKEQQGILHFGIDVIQPNEDFDVVQFLACYEKAKNHALEHGKNLIIVGGTGFYLKTLIDGISPSVEISTTTQQYVQKKMQDSSSAYALLQKVDPSYMKKIKHNDTYRITKALEIYKQSGLSPSDFFQQNPKVPIAPELQLFEIIWDAQDLRKRISLRTEQMIAQGVINEVIDLEQTYGRLPNCMRSIGIAEVLDYLDGKSTRAQLEEFISIHTAQLAKRQRTFNRNQFNNMQTKNL